MSRRKSKGPPEDLSKTLGQHYNVRKLSPYHFRVEGQIDLYPTNRLFHVIATGERGHYDKPGLLLKLRLREAEASKPALDPDEWKEIEGRPFVYIDLLDDVTKARKAAVPQEYFDAKRKIYDAAMALPWPKQ